MGGLFPINRGEWKIFRVTGRSIEFFFVDLPSENFGPSMEAILIMALGLLPVLAFLIYIFVKDTKKEPLGQLLKAFLAGALICLPIIIIEQTMQVVLFGGREAEGFFESAIEMFISVAPAEEGLKLLAFWLVVFRNRHFDEHFDGIVYAVYVSLGFAAVENVGYLFNNMDSWLTVGIMRAFLSIPGHYAFGVLMGYFYSMYYWGGRQTKYLLLTFFAPWLAHGLYDALLTPIPYIGYFTMVIMLFLFHRMQRFCMHKLDEQLEKDVRTMMPPLPMDVVAPSLPSVATATPPAPPVAASAPSAQNTEVLPPPPPTAESSSDEGATPPPPPVSPLA